MSFKKVVLAAAMLAAMAFSASARGSSEPAAEPDATIDFRFNAVSDDGQNYLNWSVAGENIADTFDAASGASRAQTTSRFNAVRYDASGQRKAVPAGLRGLVLYPVASRATADNDAFTVETQGNQVTVTFIHYGTAYRITTDSNGSLSLSGGGFQTASVCENIGGRFLLRAEYVKEGGDRSNMADADWSKIPLVADAADSDADYTYDGTLTLRYANGVLTMTGGLTRI